MGQQWCNSIIFCIWWCDICLTNLWSNIRVIFRLKHSQRKIVLFFIPRYFSWILLVARALGCFLTYWFVKQYSIWPTRDLLLRILPGFNYITTSDGKPTLVKQYSEEKWDSSSFFTWMPPPWPRASLPTSCLIYVKISFLQGASDVSVKFLRF